MYRLGGLLLKDINNKSFYNFGIKYYFPDKLNMTSKEPSFKASDLTITKTQNSLPKPEADSKKLGFGIYNTDHMLEIDWTLANGWGKPYIGPFHYFQMHPFASCLHYGIECFEGTKAYINQKDQIRWFRGDCNIYRMKFTAQRIGLPDFDGNEFINCIWELLKLDKEWIPKQPGFSAYLRPTFIGIEESLGVKAPSKAKLYCVVSPVGPYFPTGLKPIRMLANTKHIRASPGGMGEFKVGGNYGPTVQSLKEIYAQGFQQSLWMLPDGQIQEMGVCNLFFFWKNKEGETELVTPELDGTILPGVTRDAVIRLCLKMNKFKVTERKLYMKELIEAVQEKRMIEMFGSGTAVSILPIEGFGYKNEFFSVRKETGELTNTIYKQLSEIQMGEINHEWALTKD